MKILKLAMFVLTISSLANADHDFYRIAEVEVVQVNPYQESTDEPFYMQSKNEEQAPIEQSAKTRGSFSETAATLGNLSRVGSLVWDILKSNKPVTDVRSHYVSVIPEDAEWKDLSGWHRTHVETFELRMRNVLGVETVRYRYQVRFRTGGNHMGSGSYIGMLAVLPVDTKVLMGFELNSVVEVGPAVNTGSIENPVAELEIYVRNKVTTLLKTQSFTDMFLVDGQGGLFLAN